MCKDIIGPFKFGHLSPGPGYYTFAPRFYNWDKAPRVAENEAE